MFWWWDHGSGDWCSPLAMPSGHPALSLGPPALSFGPSKASPAPLPPQFGSLSSHPWTQEDKRKQKSYNSNVMYVCAFKCSADEHLNNIGWSYLNIQMQKSSILKDFRFWTEETKGHLKYSVRTSTFHRIKNVNFMKKAPTSTGLCSCFSSRSAPLLLIHWWYHISSSSASLPSCLRPVKSDIFIKGFTQRCLNALTFDRYFDWPSNENYWYKHWKKKNL